MGRRIEFVEEYEEDEDPSFADNDQDEREKNENQRDLGADDFDDAPPPAEDDRVRGAGRQSLDEIAIDREEGWGLGEGEGGLRADRPDQTVNDEESGDDEERRSA